MTEKSRQKFKYLENKKSFQGEIKSTFLIIFKGLSVGKSCLRPESAPLMVFSLKFSEVFVFEHYNINETGSLSVRFLKSELPFSRLSECSGLCLNKK